MPDSNKAIGTKTGIINKLAAKIHEKADTYAEMFMNPTFDCTSYEHLYNDFVDKVIDNIVEEAVKDL